MDPLEGPSYSGVPSPPSPAYSPITLVRDGQDTIELQMDQVTPTAVARIFSVRLNCMHIQFCYGINNAITVVLQISLDSVWLREAGPGDGFRAAFFPDSRNRHFDFSGDVGFIITRLSVQGSPSCRSDSTRVLSIGSTKAPGTSTVTPIATKKSNSINVKIIQGTIPKRSASGRPEIKYVSQTFIDINESTANVMYLTHVIKELWGPNYVLITADGMKIEDSSGTNIW